MQVRLPPLEVNERASTDGKKYTIRWIQWNVKPKKTVEKGCVLGEYAAFCLGQKQAVWRKTLKATVGCEIRELCVKTMDELKVEANPVLCFVNVCTHEVQFGGLCAQCGADLSNVKLESRLREVVFAGKSDGAAIKKIQFTKKGYKDAQKDNTATLLQQKKLLLVLDIDHTFLHATKNPQAEQVKNHPDFASSVYSFFLPEDKIHPYYIKIRPKFQEFLAQVKPYFDIVVYTHALRKYAEKVVECIDDPKKPIVKNIVCRDDFPKSKTKRVERLFPVENSMVVILDDRDDVWDVKHNVLKIHKYIFWPDMFTKTGHQEDANLKSLVGQRRLGLIEFNFVKPIRDEEKAAVQQFMENCFADHRCYGFRIFQNTAHILIRIAPDEKKMRKVRAYMKDQLGIWEFLPGATVYYKVDFEALKQQEGDMVLPYLIRPLLNVHEQFFKQKAENLNPDVRRLMKEEKKSVFANCVFVFSGMFRSDVNLSSTEEWKKARMFGAKCLSSISPGNPEGVTHVISASNLTAKAVTGFEHNICVVHPHWFQNSVTHWYRCQEKDFLLQKPDQVQVKQFTTPVPMPAPPKRKKKQKSPRKVKVISSRKKPKKKRKSSSKPVKVPVKEWKKPRQYDVLEPEEEVMPKKKRKLNDGWGDESEGGYMESELAQQETAELDAFEEAENPMDNLIDFEELAAEFDAEFDNNY